MGTGAGRRAARLMWPKSWNCRRHGDAMRELTIVNAAELAAISKPIRTFLYARLQRKGLDRADVHRLANRDRHVFAALMLAHGHGDGMVTGATRKNRACAGQLINHVFDAGPQDGAVGVSVVLLKGQDRPDRRYARPRMARGRGSGRLSPTRGAEVARGLGLVPAWRSCRFRTSAIRSRNARSRWHQAPKVLDAPRRRFRIRRRDDRGRRAEPGAMANYPFSRLTGPANVLVVPARHSASISVKLMQEMAGATSGR